MMKIETLATLLSRYLNGHTAPHTAILDARLASYHAAARDAAWLRADDLAAEIHESLLVSDEDGAYSACIGHGMQVATAYTPEIGVHHRTWINKL
jgi:hypothetical protein